MTSAKPLVVVGDTLLDVDLVGEATRVAPDAPALVVDAVTPRPRAGGAGLAARLAAAQGRDVVLVTPVAGDEAAERLRETLTDVRLVALPWQGTTAVKQRVRAGGQTLIRLDSGGARGEVGEVPDELSSVLARAGAVLVSDYGRGALAAPQVRAALERLPRRVPLVWDPHPRGAPPLPGARLITPNEAEAAVLAEASGFAPPDSSLGRLLATIEARAAHLVGAWAATAVAVTLGHRGALLSYGDVPPEMVPAQPTAGADPCGAGDCFAATAAGLLAQGELISAAVSGAVAEASRFVQAGGASGFAERLAADHDSAADPQTVVATSGCFDLLHAGHVAMLDAARRMGDRLVVLLNSDASVRRLKGPDRPLTPQHDRARVLEALGSVDEVVIFDEDTPTEAIRRLRPQLWVKGGDYDGVHLPEAEALAEYGGRIVTVAYLDGHSTTEIVARARTGTTQLREGVNR